MTSARKQPVLNPAMAREIADLVGQLRQRDSQSEYADAPLIDSYARISPSSDPTATKVERQTIDVLRRLLAGRYRLGETLIDWNRSAWRPSGSRPAFRQALERIASGASNGICAWNSDRLTRRVSEIEQLIEIGARGAIILSYSGDYDLSTSDGRLALRLQTVFAQQESDRKSERLRRKYEAQRNGEGRDDGLGEFQRSSEFGHGGVDAATLRAEREAIAWGINAVIEGRSWTYVANEWNSRGLQTRNGQRFTLSKVATILTRPRHAGYLTVGEGKTRTILGFAHDVEPIVDTRTWERFAAMLAGRSMTPGRPAGKAQGYLLGGLLRCGVCAIGMRCSGFMYRCNPAIGCGDVHVNAALLDEVIGPMVVSALADPQHVETRRVHSAQATKLNAAIVEAERRQANILAAYQRGHLADQAFAATLATTAGELGDLRERLAALGDLADVDQRPRSEAHWRKSWQRGDRDERRRLFRAAFPRGVAITAPAVRYQRSTAERVAARVLTNLSDSWLAAARATRAA